MKKRTIDLLNKFKIGNEEQLEEFLTLIREDKKGITLSTKEKKSYFDLCDAIVNNSEIITKYFTFVKSINDTFDEVKPSAGVKGNSGKLEMSVLFKQFPLALQATMLASTYGHKKYEKHDQDYLNFKRVEGGSKTYFDAGVRHALDGSYNLDESGLPHIFHECFDKLAQCELWMEENNIDIKKMSKKMINTWDIK